MYRTFGLIHINRIHNKAINSTKELALKIDSKIKGTFVENLVKFWTNVCRDYKDVSLDVYKDMKTKPVKTFFVFSSFGFLTLLFKNNPNETSFRSKYVSCANDILLVHPEMRRQESVNHLNYIGKCYNNDLIRYRSLGFISIIWVDNTCEHCNTYESNCKYLKLRYKDVFSNILDVGFLNIWWVISRNMLDYDINY